MLIVSTRETVTDSIAVGSNELWLADRKVWEAYDIARKMRMKE